MAEERAAPSERESAGTRPVRRPTELHALEYERGPQPGTQYVRITRLHGDKLRRVRRGYMRATPQALVPEGGIERVWYHIRRVLFGRPLASSEAHHERLSKKKALAVFASDALSSSAYAPEEVLLVLATGGAAALAYGVPIALAILVLLAIVAFSYSQTIRCYPNGGGTYIVTRDNLGTVPSLVAASALMIGYILTVAVSISAGVAAITSALPALEPYTVPLAVGFIVLLMIANLRGVSESGTIFAAPTYLFIGTMLLTLGVALAGLVTGRLQPVASPETVSAAAQPVTLFLILRAFTQGSSALTGTEAIADGVPAFQPPAPRNAIITLITMAVILGVLFFGITYLATALNLLPRHDETIVSQLAHAVWGDSPLYYLVQAVTMLILVLAANTAFADFPRVNYFLARDNFMARQFEFRGDRLAFNTGISFLAIVAIALVIAFQADVSALIPLYGIGVFIAFACSQASMVRRWWRGREPGWQTSLPVNVVGALTTGGVAVTFAVTNFQQGAWVVLVLIPGLVALMLGIHRHYTVLDKELAPTPEDLTHREVAEQVVLVPVRALNRPTLKAIDFARSISKNVQAVHVTDDANEAKELRKIWEAWNPDVQLIILESPFRSLSGPLMAYIDALDAQDEHTTDLPITIVLPEFVPRHWWEWFLHNQSAFRLRARLHFRPNTVVVSVPYHIGQE